MNRYAVLAAAATLALAIAPAPAPVQAATSVQKCQGADGSIGYTDGSCKVFGGDSVVVATQLVSESASGEGSGDRADAMATTSIAPGRRSPADGCARTPTQLAMDLQGALALGDVNRVAESYHWTGMSNAAGQQTMDRLQGLVGRPVLDSRYLDASFGFAGGTLSASNSAVTDAGAGTLQLMLGNADGQGAASIDFDVHRYQGCYFVSF